MATVAPAGALPLGKRRLSAMATEKLTVVRKTTRRISVADQLNVPKNFSSKSASSGGGVLSVMSQKGVSMRFSASKYSRAMSSAPSAMESISDETTLTVEPTSKKEYGAWYLIDFAQNPYFYSVLNFCRCF